MTKSDSSRRVAIGPTITLSNGRVLSVKTNHVRPPVHVRSHDWTAVDDRTYEGGDLIGWGATEQEAVADLLEQICNDEDVCLPGCPSCAKALQTDDLVSKNTGK